MKHSVPFLRMSRPIYKIGTVVLGIGMVLSVIGLAIGIFSKGWITLLIGIGCWVIGIVIRNVLKVYVASFIKLYFDTKQATKDAKRHLQERNGIDMIYFFQDFEAEAQQCEKKKSDLLKKTMIMAISNNDLKKVMLSKELAVIEWEIAKLEDCRVGEFMQGMADSLKYDLSISGLELAPIIDILHNHSKELLNFIISARIETGANKPEKETKDVIPNSLKDNYEEFPTYHEPRDYEDSQPELCNGFGIEYAIYLYFLKNMKKDELFEHLKKSGRSEKKAKKYAQQLIKAYLKLNPKPAGACL